EPLHGLFTPNLVNTISTPGAIQQAVIYPAGELLKSVDITPFSQDADFDGTVDESLTTGDYADDTIYGGLGGDFLHGGSGDDAISGAEALLEFFEAPANPGDVLRH